MYIHSITLENVKAFETLSLEFARPESGLRPYEGFNVFVGGNSSGKSTLLKCLAMAISGPTVANQQLITPAGWIRRGASRALIETSVHWQTSDTFRSKGGNIGSGARFSAGLTFEAVSGQTSSASLRGKRYQTSKRTKVTAAERGPWHPESTGWFLGAYGPLRRLTGSSTEAMRYALGKGKLASCVTLFREDAALSESETWLKQEHARTLERKSEGQSVSGLVDDVQAMLNDGLLPEGFSISRITVDDVFMTTPNGGELPLRDLSDGCRSVYALMLDIIHSMTTAYGEHRLFSRDQNNRIVVNHSGVILIDEIEAHLHPSWQRLICDWLKTRFPNIQFFVTTHSPLVAQAADEGGLFVLPLPREIESGRRTVRRLSATEQKRINLGRAEKVLLGEAFGLHHTWSIKAQELVQRWEELTALRQARPSERDDTQTEYEALKPQIELIFDTPLELAYAQVA